MSSKKECSQQSVTVAQKAVVKEERVPEIPKSIRIAGSAWAKALCWAFRKDDEVGFMGVTTAPETLDVSDVVMLKQEVGAAQTDLDGGAFGEMLEEMQDRGIGPVRCGKVWFHTHPDLSPEPSGQDLQTVHTLGGSGWAAMVILGLKDRGVTAKGWLSLPTPMGRVLVARPVVVDWGWSLKSWQDEYDAKVSVHVYSKTDGRVGTGGLAPGYKAPRYMLEAEVQWDRDDRLSRATEATEDDTLLDDEWLECPVCGQVVQGRDCVRRGEGRACPDCGEDMMLYVGQVEF